LRFTPVLQRASISNSEEEVAHMAPTAWGAETDCVHWDDPLHWSDHEDTEDYTPELPALSSPRLGGLDDDPSNAREVVA
jgi:hypothetical protein